MQFESASSGRRCQYAFWMDRDSADTKTKRCPWQRLAMIFCHEGSLSMQKGQVVRYATRISDAPTVGSDKVSPGCCFSQKVRSLHSLQLLRQVTPATACCRAGRRLQPSNDDARQSGESAYEDYVCECVPGLLPQRRFLRRALSSVSLLRIELVVSVRQRGTTACGGAMLRNSTCGAPPALVERTSILSPRMSITEWPCLDAPR